MYCSGPNDETKVSYTKPAEKKLKALDTKHVTFKLQNDEEPIADNDEAYQVIAEAAPIWRSALNHRIHENRAHLRAATYREFVTTST